MFSRTQGTTSFYTLCTIDVYCKCRLTNEQTDPEPKYCRINLVSLRLSMKHPVNRFNQVFKGRLMDYSYVLTLIMSLQDGLELGTSKRLWQRIEEELPTIRGSPFSIRHLQCTNSRCSMNFSITNLPNYLKNNTRTHEKQNVRQQKSYL